MPCGELLWYAAEVKLRAERRAGAMLGELGLRPGRKSSQAASNSLPPEGTWSESSRWQEAASLPEEDLPTFTNNRGLRKLPRRCEVLLGSCGGLGRGRNHNI